MDSSVRRSIVRLLLLGGFTALFLVALLLERTPWSLGLAVLLVGGFVWAIKHQFHTLSAPFTFPLKEGGAFVLGAILTYGLHSVLSWPVILASAVVGLIAFLWLKEYAVAIFAGTFLGMSDALLLGQGWLILALILGGSAYLVFKPTLLGFGGRLGWVAWLGSVSVFLIRFESFEPAARIAFDGWIYVVGVLVFGLSTFLLKDIKYLDAVAASSLVGIALGLLEGWGVAGISIYAIPWYGATFVGMSSRERFNHGSLVAALLLYGAMFYLIHPYYPFTGGKLGALSYVSGLCVWGTLHTFKKKS